MINRLHLIYCFLPKNIFSNLQGFDIENFISLWDFLNKRFFFHLDSEHINTCGLLKSDLLKYYLVHAVKAKNKEKITEFFSMYSHEILADHGNSIPGSLRSWFVLPYIDEPDKDPEFSAYFAQRWADLLRITLHNFLSIVLLNAPPPKLVLLDKWFRSEAQQEIRYQMKQSSRKIDSLITRIEHQEDRLRTLRETVKSLATLLLSYQINLNRLTDSNGNNSGGSSSSNSQYINYSRESLDEMEHRRTSLQALGKAAAHIATDCVKNSAAIQSLSREERLRLVIGKECYALLYPDNSSNNNNNTGSGTNSGTNTSTNVLSGQKQINSHCLSQDSGSNSGNINSFSISIEEHEALLVNCIRDWTAALSISENK